MSFTTKVKATGQLFNVTTEVGKNHDMYRDAHAPLRTDTVYAGHLIDAYPGSSPFIEFSTADWAVFGGEELEEFYTDLRLLPIRP